MNILITAGPTREYRDPVRFISNASSGRMGLYIAEEAAGRDHDVSLVLGPTALDPDDDAGEVCRVTTAEQMRSAVFDRFDECDVLVMAAAVTDVRPAETADEKVKKSDLGDRMELEPTPDILEEAGRRKEGQTLIGFAVESERLEEHGRSKMRRKNLDLLVLNRPSAMGSRRNKVFLLDASGSLEPWQEQEKDKLAGQLVDRILQVAQDPGER
jgi:phosphopantothenoylcysteine decarboxylase/phosphopantothenate--cysteine ligase